MVLYVSTVTDIGCSTCPHQAMPVAPLYGDVQIKLPLLVKGLPHHDPGRWSCTSESLDDKLSITITDKIDQIRQEHVQIMSRLARYNNEVHNIMYMR